MNKFVGYKHCKIKSIQNVLELIRSGVYMTSIDLRDAFCWVPVHKNRQTYLTFFVGKYLKLVYMQNGCRSAMRISTKISKIPFSVHREKGNLRWWVYLQGDDYEDCSLMFGTQYKFLDPLDSQSTQTKPSSYQHNVSPT